MNLFPTIFRLVGAVNKFLSSLVIYGDRQKTGVTSGNDERKILGYDTKLRHDLLLHMKFL
jgi:hypothetical protein